MYASALGVYEDVCWSLLSVGLLRRLSDWRYPHTNTHIPFPDVCCRRLMVQVNQPFIFLWTFELTDFPDGPAGAFEQKLTVSLFVEHANRNLLNVD